MTGTYIVLIFLTLAIVCMHYLQFGKLDIEKKVYLRVFLTTQTYEAKNINCR